MASKKTLNEFLQQRRPRTVADFSRHAEEMSGAVVKYLSDIFLADDAPLAAVVAVASATRAFDPRQIAAMPDASVKIMLQSLFDNSRISALDSALLEKMVTQLPALRKQIATLSLDEVEGAAAYDAALKIKKTGQPSTLPVSAARTTRDPPPASSWCKDLTETGRRIWAFWRALGLANVCSAWAKAARIVVLIQMSTGFVERSFSQAGLIEDACGETMLRDNLESRMFVRCNKDVPVTISGFKM